jgi:hypothetical protein
MGRRREAWVVSNRFRDPGLWVELVWATPVLLRCPSCGHSAVCAPRPGSDVPLWVRGCQPRLSCLSCGYTKDRDPDRQGYTRSRPVDPFFGADLLLQDECVGHTLWAYNVCHLDLIDEYAAASLRERANLGDSRYQTMLEKLPAWMKSAKNRAAIARSVGRMRDLLPSENHYV